MGKLVSYKIKAGVKSRRNLFLSKTSNTFVKLVTTNKIRLKYFIENSMSEVQGKSRESFDNKFQMITYLMLDDK
jgi:hypothetical protein